MNPNHVYDMIIVGGGPGGYTSALYAARAGLDTGVERNTEASGNQLRYLSRKDGRDRDRCDTPGAWNPRRAGPGRTWRRVLCGL